MIYRADFIASLDACFTQKRCASNKGTGHGPANHHPETVFLSEAEISAMKAWVESLRPPKAAKEGAPDGYEHAMKVPTSVLDGCLDSFTAADQKRVKASTKFFADTGLMALLCRHDRVLWIANMTTAGERQYYALALVQKLFQNIPSTMTVGLLYDIGCQLDRSCQKWDFLAEYRDRITFGISVFHAYGHQWPCQVIYHPRKCIGFGYSDGEGCERFWSSIKLLIPSMRVSGYYRRLFSIDNQVRFLDNKSLMNLGDWLYRKWTICDKRRGSAMEILSAVGIDLDVLRNEWQDQVKEQTKPLPRQSKHLATKAVNEVIGLVTTKAAYTEELRKSDNMLLNGDYEEDMDFTIVIALRKTIHGKIESITKLINKKKAAIGIKGRENLRKLANNKYLRAKLNARALKQRIRSRLRDRKFELSRLERAYRQTGSNESKLHSHVSSQVKRHEPGIMSLCNKYNALCLEMEKSIKSKEAPAGATLPPQIQKEGLFKLDVDDDIWQDIGLEDLTEDAVMPVIPNWLGDEMTRKGIKALLELDRCNEEVVRLSRERCAMQEWIQEEWLAVDNAWCNCSKDNMGLKYQLNLKRQSLTLMAAHWKLATRIIPGAYEIFSSWGPSEEDMNQALKENSQGNWDYEKNSENDDEEEEYYDDDGDGDANHGDHEDLWDALEVSAYADALRAGEDTDFPQWEIDDESVDLIANTSDGTRSRSISPEKRRRVYYDPDVMPSSSGQSSSLGLKRRYGVADSA